MAPESTAIYDVYDLVWILNFVVQIKYATYRNAAREGPNHGHGQHAQKFWWSSTVCFRAMRADKHTNRKLITIVIVIGSNTKRRSYCKFATWREQSQRHSCITELKSRYALCQLKFSHLLHKYGITLNLTEGRQKKKRCYWISRI